MEHTQPNYEQLSTEALNQMLREDFTGQAPLPVDTILRICTILAERSPRPGAAEEALRSFWKDYSPE